jgi:hypothetical protein
VSGIDECRLAHDVSRAEWDGFAAIARLDRRGNEVGDSIRSAYLDMSRTLYGMATFENAVAWRHQTTDYLQHQLEALTRHFAWSRNEFDGWHRATAFGLIEVARNSRFPITVGQAQKWINMCIKNGIALGERLSPGFSCVYDVAHVALDESVIRELKQKKGMPHTLLRGPWSKLKDYEEYVVCQQWIRDNLTGLPVEEEFRLWQEGRAGTKATPASNTVTKQAEEKPVPVLHLHSQVVGNAGLYYCCYKLSLLGWNVMPTARNVRGVDIIAYSWDAKRKIALQVKALSKRDPVPVGSSLGTILGDFWVIIDKVNTEHPRAFILLPSDVMQLAHPNKTGTTPSFWLEPPMYDQDVFREAWDRIGRGDKRSS